MLGRRAKLAILAGALSSVLVAGLVLSGRESGSESGAESGPVSKSESIPQLLTSAVDEPSRVEKDGATVGSRRRSEPAENLDAAAEFARAKVDALFKNQKSAPSSGASASEQALQRLIQIRQCEKLAGAMDRITLSSAESARCPVNHPEALADAGGYAQVLVDQTVMELAFLRELALASRANGLNDPYDVARIAKTYVNHADDNVREQALALAEILPDSQGQTAMEIAAKALASTVSGPLSTQALAILARHRSVDSKLADGAVVRALKESGWDVKDAVASQSLPFVTAQNREEFAKIMNSEPERSKLRLHLRLNLEEFDRMARL